MTTQPNCHVSAIPNHVNRQDFDTSSTVRLAISGLGCRSCATRVQNALIMTPGVVDAAVNLGAAQADVWYSPELIGPVGLTRVVLRAGIGSRHRYRAVPVRPVFPAEAKRA